MDEEHKSSHRGIIIAATIIGLPFCYVLSFGPAMWLMEHGYLSHYVVMYVYMPIDMLATMFPPVARVLNRYMAFWLR